MENLFVHEHIEKALRAKGCQLRTVEIIGFRGWLIQQVMDWFEKEHKIIFYPKMLTNTMWFCEIINDYTKTHVGSGNFTYFSNIIMVDNNYQCFTNRYKAIEAGIEKALELI